MERGGESVNEEWRVSEGVEREGWRVEAEGVQANTPSLQVLPLSLRLNQMPLLTLTVCSASTVGLPSITSSNSTSLSIWGG